MMILPRSGFAVTLVGLMVCSNRAEVISSAAAASSAAPPATALEAVTPPPPAGPCITPPRVRFVVFAEGDLPSAQPMWTAETHPAKLDVDGLGTPIVLVPSTSAGTAHPSNVRFTMYLMRGSCGVDIGAFQGLNEPWPLAASTQGLRDLENLWPTGVRGHDVGALAVQVLRFDGQRYTPVGPAQPR